MRAKDQLQGAGIKRRKLRPLLTSDNGVVYTELASGFPKVQSTKEIMRRDTYSQGRSP